MRTDNPPYATNEKRCTNKWNRGNGPCTNSIEHGIEYPFYGYDKCESCIDRNDEYCSRNGGEAFHETCHTPDLFECWYDDEYEIPFFIWNPMSAEWQCPRCDMGLSRIYDPRNTLEHWVVQ